MDTVMSTSTADTGAAPEWANLHWEEMKRVFNTDDDNLPVTDDGAPDMKAGMWPLVNWDEVKRILEGDETTLENFENEY